jgi:hypothetical protein
MFSRPAGWHRHGAAIAATWIIGGFRAAYRAQFDSSRIREAAHSSRDMNI